MGIELAEFALRKASLDEAFLALTGDHCTATATATDTARATSPDTDRDTEGSIR
jgi:hypothetical protein